MNIPCCFCNKPNSNATFFQANLQLRTSPRSPALRPTPPPWLGLPPGTMAEAPSPGTSSRKRTSSAHAGPGSTTMQWQIQSSLFQLSSLARSTSSGWWRRTRPVLANRANPRNQPSLDHLSVSKTYDFDSTRLGLVHFRLASICIGQMNCSLWSHSYLYPCSIIEVNVLNLVNSHSSLFVFPRRWLYKDCHICDTFWLKKEILIEWFFFVGTVNNYKKKDVYTGLQMF